MAGYDVHLRSSKRWASFITVVVLAPAYLYTESVSAAALVGAISFLFGVIGGILPDVDSYSSIPRRHGENILSTVLLVGYSFTVGFCWDTVEMALVGMYSGLPGQISIPGTGLLFGGVGVVLIVLNIENVIQWISPGHRKLLHSFSFWGGVSLALGLGLASVAKALTQDVRVAVSMGIAVGFALYGGTGVHLWIDEELPP